MPKFKSTQDILRIIGNRDQIRNFGVIAHVDHGKTTMSDSLLAASGIISPTVAGQALALDSMKLEQNRQMTIRGANVTLFYETEGKEYVINKIDRLVKELKLNPDEMQRWLMNIINHFSQLIDIYAEPEIKEKWKVSIQG